MEDEILKTISVWEQICDFPPTPQQVLFCVQSLRKKGYDIGKIQAAGLKHYETSRKFPMPAELIPILEGPDYGRARPIPPYVSIGALPPPKKTTWSVEKFKASVLENAESFDGGKDKYLDCMLRGAISLEGIVPVTRNLKQAIVEIVGKERWDSEVLRKKEEAKNFRRIFA